MGPYAYFYFFKFISKLLLISQLLIQTSLLIDGIHIDIVLINS